MSWHIHINGIVIGDEQELREQIPPDLLEDAGHHNALIADILEGANSPRPSEIINQWSEREPGAMSMLEYVQAPVVVAQPMELTSEPLDRQIATLAATGLMRGHEDNVMILEGTGFMVINEENPPSLEGAGDIAARLFKLTEAAEKLDEFGKWQRGSFLDSCENVYGENFSVTQFVEASDDSYSTTINCLATFRAFRTGRFENLSFTHHREAHHTTLNDDEDRSMMRRLLRISNHFRLSCAQQRKLFSYARNFGSEPIGEIEEQIDFTGEQDLTEARDQGMITDKEQLVERVTTRESNRNYLFKFQRIWHHYRGVREALPAGATEIICTDDWRQVRNNGTDADIPVWTPAGTPAEEPT